MCDFLLYLEREAKKSAIALCLFWLAMKKDRWILRTNSTGRFVIGFANTISSSGGS